MWTIFNKNLHRLPLQYSSLRPSSGCQRLDRVVVRARRFKSTDPRSAATVASSSTAPGIETPVRPAKPVIDELDLSFTNSRNAFKSKTTGELARAVFVLSMCRMGWIVDNSRKLMKLGRTVLGQRMFALLMKKTFYGHFVAGENKEAIKPQLDRMLTFGVKSILDYSAEEDLTEDAAVDAEMIGCDTEEAPTEYDEDSIISQYRPRRDFGDRRKSVYSARTVFYENEIQCEKNLETFLDCIDAVSDSTRGSGFAAIKLTALGKPQVLMQLSSALLMSRQFIAQLLDNGGSQKPGYIYTRKPPYDTFEKKMQLAGIDTDTAEFKEWMRKIDYDDSGLIDLTKWNELLSKSFSLKDMFKLPIPSRSKGFKVLVHATKDEEERFKNMIRRLRTLCDYAEERDVRLMVDAEQSYFQPAIARITLELMRRYNKERNVVFNTYQCYLKETHDVIQTHLSLSAREDFYFGCKLVRGAYMIQERERAAAVGYEDPVNENFEATTAMMERVIDTTFDEIVRRADKKKVAIMVASHNEDTVRHVVQKMKDLNISAEDRVVCFAQLLGMCDQVSFSLGQAGYSVYKYVPYGEVDEVMPYLLRRAYENRDVLGKSTKELNLLKKELLRRLVTGNFFYKPKGDYWPLLPEDAKPMRQTN